LRPGVAEREAEAFAHDTAIHHVRHPGFKHMARYTLHYMKPSRARADMREAAQREGSGVGKISDANVGVRFSSAARQWLGRVSASQTHISIVAGSGHEFYTKNAGKKGSVQGQEQRRTR
jgi:hypothetical protein